MQIYIIIIINHIVPDISNKKYITMRKSSKLKCCGITSLVIGLILLALGIAWTFIIGALVKSGAKKQAALTQSNEKNWRGIPGHFDLFIARKNYVFNCTNHDDVVYKGASPIVEEFGPYIYRETDDYADPKYGLTLKNPQDGAEKSALSTVQTQGSYYSGTDVAND